MAEPFSLLQGLRASTSDLVRAVSGLHWSDDDVAAPSLCPGWTRGHVLTHVARNADGIADTLAGALRGEIVPRYPQGREGRNADIEAGARRPYAELAADVRDSAERLDRMFGAVDDAGGWELPTEREHPARHWLTARWTEVEIHRVDLDADYLPDRWPPLLVTVLLPEVASSLGARAEVPVRVRVTAEGSLAPDTVGQEWAAGEGDAVEVTGPDWAVLAWLVGRPSTAESALSTLPPLAPW